MLEMILSPRRAERRPWELFFVGLIYAGLSVLLVHWIFSGDEVLVKYSGIFVVTFSIMFSMPYMYYLMKIEAQKEYENEDTIHLFKEHSKAIYSFLFLFLGFLVAFFVMYIALGSTENYRAQIETYCGINYPNNYEFCTSQYGLGEKKITGGVTKTNIFGAIFTNNLYVLIFSIIFSVIFGAGGIFILAWNASVIAAAMVIFAKSNIYSLPLSLLRYMIHGFPEIGAYFMGTLAGGMIGISLLRKEFGSERFFKVLRDSCLLVLGAIIILLIAAWVEVYITPLLI
jgi:uncharacterized membrane protein SpoIIM required for sporulation